MNKLKLVATDLDGTFLADDKSILPRNIEALHALGDNGIIRVAATGRNLRKVKEVIAPEVPFDFVIFSSGAGIYDWNKKKHIFQKNISSEISHEITKFLLEKKVNFNAFKAVPENHYLWYHRGGSPCEEFERYFAFHNSFASPLPENRVSSESLCQFLIILPNDVGFFHDLKTEVEKMYPEIGVIRSSSPLGTGFIWMEILSKNVSKGNALSFICNELSLPREHTLSIGNDYNDLELLDFTKHSFIVENAPKELKSKYSLSPANDEAGFSFAVQQFINH